MPRNLVSRADRLKSYARMEGPAGAGRDIENVRYWQGRAESNSQLAPRALDGPIRLPSTKVNVRDTAMSALVSRKVDARMAAKGDLNMVGNSPFMRGVRRTTA